MATDRIHNLARRNTLPLRGYLSSLAHKTNSLAERLRSETAPAHQHLEARIGFDIHKPDVATALAMLRAFYRVLRVLEPAMLVLVPEEVAEGRSKLQLLKADLLALGMVDDEIDAIASPSIRVPRNGAEAAGALYVMEGSTLGGKVIVKALHRLPNWPITGICYFDPYGSETGAKWRAFQSYLYGIPAADGDRAVSAAQHTFALLESGMVAEASV